MEERLARRVVGNVFVIMGGLLLLYGVYGNYAPDLFAHAGDTFPGVCTSIFYKGDGVFGIMANVLATYVILFVLFGAFLEKSGAQRLHFRERHRQHGFHRHLHDPHDEKGRVQTPRGRRHRTGGLHIRHVHAPHHGRRRLYYGRAHRGSLF